MIARSMLFALCCGTLSIAPIQSNNLSPQQLPVYGGSGGTAFTRSCGAGKVLTGLRYRVGLLVDAVGVLCRPVNSKGGLGPETTVGTLAGGSGGSSGVRNCPSKMVVTKATIWNGDYVSGITLVCRPWDSSGRQFVGAQHPLERIGTGAGSDTEPCEASTQPANGIRGRAASLVDAIGFVCDEP